MATILGKAHFNETEEELACKELYEAMKGFRANDSIIMQVLIGHNNHQRHQIALKYKTLYGQDLIEALKKDLSHNFQHSVVALMTPPAIYFAQELRKAMKGPGTDDTSLIEILCRTNEEIRAIRAAYEAEFKGRSLEKDLESETSGHFKRLLVAQCNAQRAEGHHVDHSLVQQDTEALVKAGASRWGRDETEFDMVLCSRSFAHLREVFAKYPSLSGGKTIKQTIEKDIGGHLRDGLCAIISYCENPHQFYAERLYKSMKGLGTDDNTLIRLIVTRSEVDLKDVAREFQMLYKKTLADFIKGDCSGDYCKLLLEVLGTN